MDNKAKIFILFIFPIILYFNSLQNQFVYDDRYTIVKNERLKDIRNLQYLFTLKYFEISGAEQTYRPIVTFSYFLDHLFWKLNPLGYHLVNILLHAANSILAFFLLKMLLFEEEIAFVSSLIYLSHPALSEAINCISYREDLLFTLFFIVGFILYIKSKEKINHYFFLSTISYIFSLFSKEMAITFPLTIFLYDLFLKTDELKRYFKKKILKYSIYIFITLIYLYLLFIAFKHPAKSEIYSNDNFIKRIIYIPYNLTLFSRIAIFPIFLNADYTFSYPDYFFSVKNILAYTLTITVIIYIVYTYIKNEKTVFFGLLLFFISLLPVLNIIKLYKPIAERYLYLPLLWFSLFICSCIYKYTAFIIKETKTKKILLSIIIISILSFYSFSTINRNKSWKNELTLWTDVIKKSPNSENANNNLGALYFINNNLDEAEKYYKRAKELNPKNDAYYINLGQLYIKKGLYDKAIEELLIAIKLYPYYSKTYELLGLAYREKNFLKEAISCYENSLKLNPDSIGVKENLAELYYITGEKNKALLLLNDILSKYPENQRVKEQIEKINNN